MFAMEIFLESAIAVLGVGMALFVITAFAWVNTGRRELLWGMGVVAVLTVLMIVVCETVVTDREAIRQTLRDITAMVEANDSASVPKFVVRSKPELAEMGQMEMKHHRFDKCRIVAIHEINIDKSHTPPQAIVKFNAEVAGSFMDGQFDSERVLRGFTVVFWKEDDGKWRVESYEHYEPTRFMFDKGGEKTTGESELP
jgi:ketosteroid isomerase-like protein